MNSSTSNWTSTDDWRSDKRVCYWQRGKSFNCREIEKLKHLWKRFCVDKASAGRVDGCTTSRIWRRQQWDKESLVQSGGTIHSWYYLPRRGIVPGTDGYKPSQAILTIYGRFNLASDWKPFADQPLTARVNFQCTTLKNTPHGTKASKRVLIDYFPLSIDNDKDGGWGSYSSDTNNINASSKHERWGQLKSHAELHNKRRALSFTLRG